MPDLLERLGGFDVDNRRVAARYVAARVALPELARWGHQVAGMPWEGRPEVAGARAGTRVARVFPPRAAASGTAGRESARRVPARSAAQRERSQ